jgi:hypothetical protein
MTDALGDALSHMSGSDPLKAIFRRIDAREFARRAPNRGSHCWSPTGGIVPREAAWAHELSAGTAGPAGHSIIRNTC